MRADVQKIFVQTPVEKQVMMFSATLSPEVRVICRKFMSDVRAPLCCVCVCFAMLQLELLLIVVPLSPP